jgi:predicted transcriptional regulator
MGTIQPIQQPNGANGKRASGNTADGHGSHRCLGTGKRSFTTKLEAEQFEGENRIRFGEQYAYKCEQCPAYHLTSKPRDAVAIGQSNLKRLEPLASAEASPKSSANRRGRGETEAEVKKLWEQGLSDAEIASQLGISSTAVVYHRKKFGAANKQGERTSPRLKTPLTLAELDEQKRLAEQEFQEKLLVFEQRRQQIEAATRLTVAECDDGKSVYIRFGHHSHLVIPKDKVPELTDSLMRWV